MQIENDADKREFVMIRIIDGNRFGQYSWVTPVVMVKLVVWIADKDVTDITPKGIRLNNASIVITNTKTVEITSDGISRYHGP